MPEQSGVAADRLSLPSGGGAISGNGESFSPNLFTGAATLSVPIAMMPGRGGMAPTISLQYSTGHGNGPFGLGCRLGVQSIARRTERGIPHYGAGDVFMLSGLEELVERADRPPRIANGFRITTYRPRVEGLFARIEHWARLGGAADPALSDEFWRVTSRAHTVDWYGRTPQAIVADPANGARRFQWMLELSCDTRGNFIRYTYTRENYANAAAHERGRGAASLYLKRIDFNAVAPLDGDDANAVAQRLRTGPLATDFLSTALFDYGEHGTMAGADEVIDATLPQTVRPWAMRPDPFSSYRSGFEIRTRRRCKRVLVFQNLVPGAGGPTLARSTDFLYATDPRTGLSLLQGVTARGYRPAPAQPGVVHMSEDIALGQPGVRSSTYTFTSLPRLNLGYTSFMPERAHYVALDTDGGSLPGRSLADRAMSLVDLFGVGLPDLVESTRTGTAFWRNLGNGRFERSRMMASAPVGVALGDPGVDFGDMAGDGRPDLLVHAGTEWGYYELSARGEWERFHRYPRVPAFRPGDADVRMIDLTGSGLVDAVRTEENYFLWFPCNEGDGFGAPRVIARVRDAATFPDVQFSDPRVHLADMTGDGLKDIVLLHDGRIDYWPNLGHGRFAPRVTMRNAPVFGPDFDPRRVHFVDVTGSGTADLLYVESHRIRGWTNQSGNAWGGAWVRSGTPTAPDPGAVKVVDLLGTGSAGILWSGLPDGAYASSYVYLDVTGGVKPYVLTEVLNHMGASTRLRHRSSTAYYLEDRARGHPWITTLPVPVQVLAAVETIDYVSGSKLVSEFAYRHGCFDGRERTFNGFACVDQRDTAALAVFNAAQPGLHGPETGFRAIDPAEYSPPTLTRTWFHTGAWVNASVHAAVTQSEYWRDDAQAFMPQSSIDAGDAPREAHRTLRGAVLRREVYGLDDSVRARVPYSVMDAGYQVRCVQPRGTRRNGVFVSAAYDTFTHTYERVNADPHVVQQLVYELDAFASPVRTLAVAYPRRVPAYPEQAAMSITYDLHSYVNQDTVAAPYFAGLPVTMRRVELAGIALGNVPLRHRDVAGLNIDGAGHTLLSYDRSYYDGPAFVGLPLGTAGRRGLLTRTERQVLGPGQRAAIYGARVQAADLAAAGYAESPAGSDAWWVPGVRTRYRNAAHFCVPVETLDPSGSYVRTTYDAWSFLAEKTTAPLGHTEKVTNDYLACLPSATIDLNDSRAACAFDGLGRVTAIAMLGGQGEGDTLGLPTTRHVYDTFAYWASEGAAAAAPVATRTFNRTRHAGDDATAPVLETVTYFDGHGTAIQEKRPFAPDPASPAVPRWIGSGWAIRNNKGLIVAQYEPFHATTSAFEPEAIYGMATETHYDALGRAVRIDAPDGSFGRVEFGAWYQASWDANDTSRDSAWFALRSMGTAADQDAAAKASAHYDTPIRLHFDPLRRSFLSIEDCGAAGRFETRSAFDEAGNVVAITDPAGNVVVRHMHDMARRPLARAHADTGDRVMLIDAAGLTRRRWDGVGRMVEHRYDALNRQTETWLTEPAGMARMIERVVYGEGRPNAASRYARGRVYRQFDESGVTTFEAYDFKGNVASRTHRIIKDRRAVVDWSAGPPAYTSDGALRFTAAYDALNRLAESTTPDGTRRAPTYSIGGGLAAVAVHDRGAAASTPIVTTIEQDARGRRTRIRYANGVATSSTYAPETGHLATLRSTAGARVLQHWEYARDAIGNLTHVGSLTDDLQYFANAVVDGSRDYTYDPLYRLIASEGREHAVGQPADDEDLPPVGPATLPQDATALRRYREEYRYDSRGNLERVRHAAGAAVWTRSYTHQAGRNRLATTSHTQALNSAFAHAYDAHGNQAALPAAPALVWNHKDQLVRATLGNGGEAHYAYNAFGERVRTVVTYQNGTVKETVSLDDFEIEREYVSEAKLAAGAPRSRHDLVHVLDDRTRVCTIETRRVVNGATVAQPASAFRYQLDDHLGSACTELDAAAAVIGYEEYSALGTTTYHTFQRPAQLRVKGFRWRGQTRDAETGLYRFGARYYMPWLGRWLSGDPLGEVGGINAYAFVQNRFPNRSDPGGHYDPAAFGDQLVGYVEVAEEFYMVENTGVASSVWNTFVATVGELAKGTTSILKVGTGAAQGVEQIRNAEDGWDIAIGASRILSDAGEVAGAALGAAGTMENMARKGQMALINKEIKAARAQRATPGITRTQKVNLSEKIGELETKKLAKQAGYSKGGDMHIKDGSNHGVDQAYTGKKPFGKESTPVLEAKGRGRATPNPSGELQKVDSQSLWQGVQDYNIDRLTQAAQSGNKEAQAVLDAINRNPASHQSFVVGVDTRSTGQVVVQELTGATGQPSVLGVVDALPDVSPNAIMHGTAFVSEQATYQTH